MIVIDASVLTDALLNFSSARAVFERLAEPGRTLHAPHLIDVEVAHAIRRHAAGGMIDGLAGRRALADVATLQLQRYPHTLLLPRIWALRDNLTAYDAAYVALAEALDAPLLTRDARLAGAPGHGAQIELV